MRRILLGIFLMTGSTSALAGLSPPATPLFDAFKTFCAATGAEPAAVASAVKAAGGTQFMPPTTTDFPFPITLASWNVEVEGQKMEISASGSFPSKKNPPFPTQVADTYTCGIEVRTNDRASVAALQKWIGIAPYNVAPDDEPTPAHVKGIPDKVLKSFAEASKDLTMYFYAYTDVNGAHVKITDPAAGRSARRAGRNRQLVLLQNPRGVSLQYMRELPIADR